MLDLDGNTIAIMTAAMDNACKRLNPDTSQARKLLAQRIEVAARQGPKTIAAIGVVADQAVRDINGSARQSKGWWSWLQTIVVRVRVRRQDFGR